jgi:hypothetical protein
MSVNPEYIEQLVLDEIAGVITPEDSATLKNILAQEPEALVICNDLYAQYGNNPILENLPDKLPIDKVWDGIRKKKRTGYVRLLTTLGIAASMLILVGSYIILSPDFRQSGLVHQLSPKNVALQMPGGQLVNLGIAEQQVKVGDVVLNNRQHDLSYSGGNSQQATLMVPAGKDYNITLADGTTIQLNANSKLQFPFAFEGARREITITGEAYIKVAKNSAKPFIVHLPNSRVEVLGTEFNVNTYESSNVRVSLVSGAVRVKTDQDSLLIHPGFAVNYTQGGKLTEIPFDADNVLAWREGIYIFSNTPLTALSAVISRCYGVDVVTDSHTVADHRFSGAMNRNKPIVTFLEGLKFTGQFDYYFDKDSILHLK